MYEVFCFLMSNFKLTHSLNNLFTIIFSIIISVKSFDMFVIFVENELFLIHQSLCYITLLLRNLIYVTLVALSMSVIKYLVPFNNLVNNNSHKFKYIHSNSSTLDMLPP
jgi:hypothetical protein